MKARSLEQALKNVEIAREKGRDSREMELCYQLGEHYRHVNEWEIALRYFVRHATLSEKGWNTPNAAPKLAKEYALACRLVGECNSMLERYDDALSYTKIYVGIAKQLKDREMEQEALQTIGNVYLDRYKDDEDDLLKAQMAYKESLRVLESFLVQKQSFEISDKRCRLYWNLSEVSRYKSTLQDKGNIQESNANEMQKELEKVKEYCLKAIDDSKAGHNLGIRVQSMVRLAQTLYQTGLSKEAKKQYEDALESANNLSDSVSKTTQIYLIYSGLAQIAAATSSPEGEDELDQLSEAVRLCKKAYRLTEQDSEEEEQMLNLYKSLRLDAKVDEFESALRSVSKLDVLQELDIHERYGDMLAAINDETQKRTAIFHYEKAIALLQSKGKRLMSTDAYLTRLNDLYMSAVMTHYDMQEYVEGLCMLQRNKKAQKGRAAEASVFLFEATLLQKNDPMQSSQASRGKIDQSLQKAKELAYRHNIVEEIDEMVFESPHIQLDGFESIEENSEASDSQDENELDPTREKESRQEAAKKRALLRKVSTKNEKGETPLHSAVINGDRAKVLHQLSLGAKVNTRDHMGWTPVHEAANHGHTEILRLLIQTPGCDINRANNEGVTPLHDAAMNGMLEVVEILLEAGASKSLNKLDRRNQRPLDVAIDDCVLVIQTAMEQQGMDVQHLETILPPSPERTVRNVPVPLETTAIARAPKRGLAHYVDMKEMVEEKYIAAAENKKRLGISDSSEADIPDLSDDLEELMAGGRILTDSSVSDSERFVVRNQSDSNDSDRENVDNVVHVHPRNNRVEVSSTDQFGYFSSDDNVLMADYSSSQQNEIDMNSKKYTPEKSINPHIRGRRKTTRIINTTKSPATSQAYVTNLRYHSNQSSNQTSARHNAEALFDQYGSEASEEDNAGMGAGWGWGVVGSAGDRKGYSDDNVLDYPGSFPSRTTTGDRESYVHQNTHSPRNIASAQVRAATDVRKSRYPPHILAQTRKRASSDKRTNTYKGTKGALRTDLAVSDGLNIDGRALASQCDNKRRVIISSDDSQEGDYNSNSQRHSSTQSSMHTSRNRKQASDTRMQAHHHITTVEKYSTSEKFKPGGGFSPSVKDMFSEDYFSANSDGGGTIGYSGRLSPRASVSSANLNVGMNVSRGQSTHHIHASSTFEFTLEFKNYPQRELVVRVNETENPTTPRTPVFGHIISPSVNKCIPSSSVVICNPSTSIDHLRTLIRTHLSAIEGVQPRIVGFSHNSGDIILKDMTVIDIKRQVLTGEREQKLQVICDSWECEPPLEQYLRMTRACGLKAFSAVCLGLQPHTNTDDVGITFSSQVNGGRQAVIEEHLSISHTSLAYPDVAQDHIDVYKRYLAVATNSAPSHATHEANAEIESEIRNDEVGAAVKVYHVRYFHITAIVRSLTHVTHLTSLNLIHTLIDDVGVEILLLGLGPKLRNLSLRGNAITHKGVKTISKFMAILSTLDLSYNLLTDDAAPFLVEIINRHCNSISRVALSSTFISDTTIGQLIDPVAMATDKLLQNIDVSENPNVTMTTLMNFISRVHSTNNLYIYANGIANACTTTNTTSSLSNKGDALNSESPFVSNIVGRSLGLIELSLDEVHLDNVACVRLIAIVESGTISSLSLARADMPTSACASILIAAISPTSHLTTLNLSHQKLNTDAWRALDMCLNMKYKHLLRNINLSFAWKDQTTNSSRIEERVFDLDTTDGLHIETEGMLSNRNVTLLSV
eukprot:CFRG4195T1